MLDLGELFNLAGELNETYTVSLSASWSDELIERGMNNLKFYRDLSSDAESWRAASLCTVLGSGNCLM